MRKPPVRAFIAARRNYRRQRQIGSPSKRNLRSRAITSALQKKGPREVGILNAD
jgi:hypothetical protein